MIMTTLDQLLEPTKPVSKSTIEGRSAPVSFSPVTRVNGSEAERGGADGQAISYE